MRAQGAVSWWKTHFETFAKTYDVTGSGCEADFCNYYVPHNPAVFLNFPDVQKEIDSYNLLNPPLTTRATTRRSTAAYNPDVPTAPTTKAPTRPTTP